MAASLDMRFAWSMMKTRDCPSNGSSMASRCRSAIRSMPIITLRFAAAESVSFELGVFTSIVLTSGYIARVMRPQGLHSPHGFVRISPNMSGVGTQFNARAKSRANVCLPTLFGPVNRYAWDSRPAVKLPCRTLVA